MKSNTLLTIIFSFLILACANKEEATSEHKPIDSELIKIFQHQYNGDADSLSAYFSHENSAYRQAALEAIGSTQDSSFLPQLSKALQDSADVVRSAAAYAIGQLRSSNGQTPLINALDAEDSLFVRKSLYEALGKCVDTSNYHILTNVSLENSLEMEGAMWGIYNAGLRGLHTDSAVSIAVHALNKTFDYPIRLAAAHFLGRTRSLEFNEAIWEEIKQSATKDAAANVRMATTLALRNSPSEKSKKLLIQILENDPDYRVKISAVRALSAQDNIDFENIAWEQINSNNLLLHLQIGYLLDQKATKEAIDELTSIFLKHTNWRVRMVLAGTLLDLNNKNDELHKQLLEAYSKAGNPYEQGEILKLLSKESSNFPFIRQQLMESNNPIIKSSALQSLLQAANKDDFDANFQTTIDEAIDYSIETADPALLAFAASHIERNKENITKGTQAKLIESKSKLVFPKHLETFEAIDKALAQLDTTFTPKEYSPQLLQVDWDKLSNIPKKQQVLITTSKGEITVELMVKKAPVSVYNFIELANEKYYNGVQYHRVVPNFVVQAGCRRGDGYGSIDHTIKTEVPDLKYEEGYLGMASAGKDTEGAQWFITHSPTPHLSGRYSIFGKVVKGMEVVHATDVSDRIISIELL